MKKLKNSFSKYFNIFCINMFIWSQGELAIFIPSEICVYVFCRFITYLFLFVCMWNMVLDLKNTLGHSLNIYLCNFYMPGMLDVGGTSPLGEGNQGPGNYTQPDERSDKRRSEELLPRIKAD